MAHDIPWLCSSKRFWVTVSGRFFPVFPIRMAQDLWGFMGISWIYPQMNGVHSFSHQDFPKPTKIPPSPQEDFGLCGHCAGDFASRQLGICEVARGYCQVFVINCRVQPDCACETFFFGSVHSWKICPKTAIFMRKFMPFQRFWENIEWQLFGTLQQIKVYP